MSGESRNGPNPGGVLYGVLAVATVIAAESTRRETFGKLVLASTITMVLYWAAHAYSHHWTSRFHEATAWTFGEITGAFLDEAPILLGAVLPLGLLVAAWLVGSSTETAVTMVLWGAGTELVVLEVLPGIRHHLGLKDLAVQSVLGISMGAGIFGVRFVLH